MRLTSKTILRPVAIGLCYLLVIPCGAQSLPSKLNVVVVQGESATNSIRRRAAEDPIVRVEDEQGRPIAEATVVFTLPTEGATGDFNGQKTIVVTTNARGEATAKPLKFNAIPGKLSIHVSASYRGLTARTLINQVTVVPPGEKAGVESGRGHGKLIVALIAIGAAAGGGVAYAASQRTQQQAAAPPSPPSAPTALGITPGTGTIAGGR